MKETITDGCEERRTYLCPKPRLGPGCSGLTESDLASLNSLYASALILRRLWCRHAMKEARTASPDTMELSFVKEVARRTMENGPPEMKAAKLTNEEKLEIAGFWQHWPIFQLIPKSSTKSWTKVSPLKIIQVKTNSICFHLFHNHFL